MTKAVAEKAVPKVLREALVAAVGLSGAAGADKHGRELEGLVAGADQDALVDLAIAQRVAGPASGSLYPWLAAGPQGKLRAHVKADTISHLNLLGGLAELGLALDSGQVTWVVVKGPALAELAYNGLAHSYLDVDLVVAAGDLPRALDLLRDRGAHVADRNWDLLLREGRAELHLTTGSALQVDLHWHLLNLGPVRLCFSLPLDELLARRRRVVLGSAEAWVLEPTDAAIHVALHAALSGGHELAWLVDIDRLVTSLPPDWDTLVGRCRLWRTGLPVAVVLNRAAHVLGTPVPPAIVDALAGGGVQRRLVESLRDWTPTGKLPGGGSTGRAVTRSLRNNLSATVREVARDAWEMAERQFDRHEYWRDPADPRHVLYDSGAENGLARYLEMVAAADRFGHPGAGPSGRRP